MLHADISNLFILQTTVNEPAPRFWEVGGMRLESSLVGPKHWFHRPYVYMRKKGYVFIESRISNSTVQLLKSVRSLPAV